MLKLDDDMIEAIKKMEKVRNIMCFLPGIDCGGCGSPTCEALAKDIIRKKADISDCVFIQKKMQVTKKLSPEHSVRIVDKIWGQDRLEKDCSKKGAKDEGS
jgi:Na+-translocating ferredoxin:NAD+ oxidoreductase RNF subunit RnfB